MIPLAKPDLRQEDIDRVVDVLRSGMLVQGKNVQALEASLSDFSGIEHCSLCSSGTAALHLALKAVGVGPGDGVIVPAFTFPASANVVELLGAETILCDVEPREYNISPEKLEQCIKNCEKYLKAVMVVHEFGCPAQIRAISELCRQHKLALIEDAACALGTIADGHHVGYYSDVGCFSFHPRKAITCGEGGAVLTRDNSIASQVKRLRSHGLNFSDNGIDFTEAGFNYRLTDFQAALIHGQLKRFQNELLRRKELAELYNTILTNCMEVHLPQYVKGHSWQSYMIVLKKSIDRDSIIRQMAHHGVQTNIGAQALNCLSYFSRKYGINQQDFHVATRLFHSGLVLPLYGGLSDKDVVFVGKTLISIIEK